MIFSCYRVVCHSGSVLIDLISLIADGFYSFGE